MPASQIPEFNDAIAVLSLAGLELSAAILEVGDLLAECLIAGNKLLICGNGGSAADSQHMAAELVSSFMKGLQRPGLPAIALTTDSSILTAYANDFGFEGVFARQVEALGQPGDYLLAISTSGRSKNVVAAVRSAQARGMRVIALTGSAPNPIADLANYAIAIPSSDTQAVQTGHLVTEHALCRIIEDRWTGGAKHKENEGLTS